MYTNEDYKEFLNDRDEDPPGDDDKFESLEDNTQPNAVKKNQKKDYFKGYLKEQQEYLQTIKDPGFYLNEKPLASLL